MLRARSSWPVAGLVLLLTLGFSTVGHANTITVNSLLDPSDAAKCTLHDAIIAANSSTATNGCVAGSGTDTINFTVSGTILLSGTLPQINKTLTIDGSGQTVTIDGGGTVAVMLVNAGAVLTLNRLTVFDGNSPGSGGGVDDEGGMLTATNCTFSNNTASIGGGAIFANPVSGANAIVSVSNSIFSGNTAGLIGGAIDVQNGLLVESVTLKILDSSFNDNSTSPLTISNGGALYIATGGGGPAVATITGSSFARNKSKYGGAIESQGTGQSLSISSSTFSKNSASELSGAIDAGGAGTAVVTNSTFYGNIGGAFGGAIFKFGSALTITNSTLSGNTAPADTGSGIANYVGTASIKGTILAANGSGGNCLIGDPITDAGYNISDDNTCGFSGTSKNNTDPKLSPAGLVDNGGPTLTIALQPISPAIDSIPHASCTDQAQPPNQLTTDQRGFPRPDLTTGPSGPCDIGAYEFELASTVLGSDAQRFGLLADSKIKLARSTTISFVNQSPAPPEVGAESIDIEGPTSYLTGDLITSLDNNSAGIRLGAHDTVMGQCVTGGAQLILGASAACGSTDTTGTSASLTTLSNAETQALNFAGYLAGLTTTTNLGNISLKKNQSMTVKLGAGLNVVAINNITSAGSNTITLSGPKNAVAVINVTGTLNLGAATQVFTNSSGLNTHNVIWNIESPNPTFGSSVVLNGTVLNFPDALTTVTFGAGSSINGAVLTNGKVAATGAMHLNFWPFTASPVQ